MSSNQNVHFFCDMSAIPLASRKQHIALIKEVFGAVQAVRELPNGYAFQLLNEKGLLVKIAEFIDNERLCCPFFSFTVAVGPADEPIWLHLTGTEGVKPFIREEIGEALNEAVARASNFR